MDYALWYQEDSFPRAQVADLAGAFEAALLGAVRAVNTRVRDVSLVGPDHLQWLHSRNEVLPEAHEECIHDAVSHFVLDNPSAPAVCAWDGSLSYGELGRLASLLARVLVQSGIRSESFVAIHLEKSRWTAVSMLAVLQVGGAFTLVDPSLPLAHKQVLCDEIACQVLITSAASRSAAPSVLHTIQVGDGQEDGWVKTSACESGECSARPDNLAYAVFTSGSTGKPKGVLIEHRSFCASARSQHRHLAIDSATRVLQFSAYSWDVSIMDQLGTLMAGGCVCVPSESQRMNELAGAIRQYGATWIQTTPAVVRLLTPDQVPSLQTVVLIGETPSHDDVKTWRGRVSLRETYGPTECSVLATVNADLAGDPRNIGRESASVCWIVDASDHDKLLPVGAIGELLIEGPILGRGYLNDAALTASVFVDNPVWASALHRPGPVRVYKTGDLAQYCHDGSIRYVRRKDTQIKLRGQRIHPGDIEHHIAVSFEGAERVLVDVLPPGAERSGPVLAAFIKDGDVDVAPVSDTAVRVDVLAAPNGAFAAKVARCQTHLESQLPKHMVPTLFLPLAWVPMTSTCKTDRRLLRRRAGELSRDNMAQYLAAGPSTKRAPTTDAERTLRDAWSRVLGMPADAMGIHDSFFRLGGDSMSAMRLVADCRAVGIATTMQGIFAHPTLHQMALHSVAGGHGGGDGRDTVGQVFPLTLAQRDLLESCYGADGMEFYQSFIVESSRPDLDADWLGRAIRVLVDRHAMLRARFEPSAASQDIWQQLITAEIETSYHVRVQPTLISNEGEVDLERQRGPSKLNVRNGPLLEVCLLHAQPNGQGHRNYMLFFCHALVADAASCRILTADMLAMLEQDIGIASHDPAPATFQTWCSLQDIKVHLSTTPNYELALKESDGDVDLDRTCQEVRLDAPSSRLLRGDANRAFSTQPMDILHAALVHSFFQTFGPRENPTICVQGDGRESGHASLDFSRTVGCFATRSLVELDANHLHSLVYLVRLAKDTRRLPRKSQSTAPGLCEIALSYETCGHQQDRSTSNTPHAKHTAPIEVFCCMVQDELVVSFTYNGKTSNDVLMAEWADKYRESLALAMPELASRAPAYTLSDFPLLQLTYETLSSLVAEVEDLARSQSSEASFAIEDAYPCAPIQRGILLSQSKHVHLYRPRFAWRVQATQAATIELPRLRRAWETVLRRHAIFRTVFAQASASDGFYTQVVLRSTPNNITELHCHGDDPVSLIRNERQAGNFQSPYPPWHLILCQTKTGNTFCDLQVNHALIDGTSIAILSSEVQRAYAGVGPVGEGPRYHGYIEYLQSTPSNTIVAYWKKRLSGISPSLFPRICGPRVHAPLEQGKRVLRSVDVEFEDASLIHQFCAQYELTVSNVVYVAWALVLRCYIQSDAPSFSYTTSGRDVPVMGAEETVGPFINALICHVQLPPEATLLDVLRNVRDVTLDSLNYQNCSLAEIGHALAIDTAELFNSSISVQDNTPRQDSSDLPMVLTSAEGADPTEYALSLHALVGKQTVALSIDYWENECLSSEQADRLIYTFRQAINTVVALPQATVVQASLLSPRDVGLIKQWNLNTPPRHERCVHHLVEQHFRDSASSLAVHSWDGDLTYGELNHLSGQLAAHLVNLGAQPETYIPLVFEKSKWTVVAMMAVMRAGAAFVLMDPTTPVRRLEDICADTQPTLVLASATHQDVLQHLSVHTIVVGPTSESTWPTLALSAVRVQPSNVVYAVFTSGSTGKPKGVIMEHASCCSTLELNKGPKGVDRNTRTFQFSTYSFDVSISDHLLAITQGGCVCIPSASQLQDIEQAIQDVGANWAELTPSVARLVNPSHVPALRTVNLGGEAMTTIDKSQWQGYAQLVNAYGNSECGPWCMAQPDVTARMGPPDIGFGTGAVCWIVDPANHQTLLPVGAVGEILLEGPAVSRGYLRQPEQTDAFFVQPPAWISRFRSAASRRFYKTGDTARYQPDGTMLYMGRKDTQVKLRGQRLELDEVAFHVRQCLLEHADVVVDLIRPYGEDARPMLAAFIHAPDDRGVPWPEDDNVLMPATAAFQKTALVLQTQLRATLPRFMVPTAYLPLGRVPLGATGKLDRKLLQVLAARMTLEALQAYIALAPSVDKAHPASELESSLQECVARVLNKKPKEVGPNDNFFYLGGDSIGAMELVTRCRHQGLTVTIPDIFRYKTIRQLAPRVKRTETRRIDGREEEVGVQFDLSPIQQAFFERVPEGRLRYNQSFMVELRQPTPHSIETAISMVVRRHAMLRASFQSEAGVWVQTITDRVKQSFRYRSAAVSSAELKHHLEESQAAVDCQNGPLLVVDHVIVDGCQYLSLIAHHLVVDLVSWRVIMSDLEVLLRGGSLLPQHHLSYPSWCRAQSEHARTHLKPLETLPSLENLHDFETDVEDLWGCSQATNTHAEAISAGFTLDSHTTTLLLGISNEALQTKPVELIHAAILVSFMRTFPGRRSPIIHQEGHGREPWDSSIDVSDTVGWFTTIFPVLVSAASDSSLVDVVRRTKDALRQMPANGWSYFAARYLHPEGRRLLDLKRATEILLNYHGTYRSLEREGNILQNTSRFDDLPSSIDPQMPRDAIFVIEAWVSGDSMQFDFIYNQNCLHQDLVRDWLTTCQGLLGAVAEELSSAPRQLTLSDFPRLSLTQPGLETLLQHFSSLGIAPSCVQDAYPCSHLQHGILFSQGRNEALYETTTKWKVMIPGLDKHLAVDRIETAWETVVVKYAALRTIIIESPSSRPYDQIVLENGTGNITISSLFGPQKEKQGPLPWSFKISQASDGEFECALTISHALVDGRSLQLLGAELAGAVNGSAIGPEILQYGQYISYLNKMSEDNVNEYWLQYLQGATPSRFPKLSALSRGQLHSAAGQISPRSLQRFCETYGTTPFNVIQVAWSLVLRCYVGSDDVCFGYLASGRDIALPGIEDAVGLFINMLVCRLQLDDSLPIMTLLEQNESNFVRSLENQHCSMAKIQHDLGLHRDPLFNSIISYQARAATGTSDLDGHLNGQAARLDTVDIDDPTEYGLVINVDAASDGIGLSLTFWDAYLDPEQGFALCDLLVQTIVQIAENPLATVAEIEMLGEADRKKIYTWNQQLPQAEQACVHHDILEQCRARPEAPAICSWDGTLTYGELDTLSSAFAVQLQTLGIGPNVFVPILLEKSLWVGIALLAVLRAGGAFVLLDPTHPDLRLQSICQTLDCQVIICSPKDHDRGAMLGTRISTISPAEPERWPVGDTLACHAEPGHAAYAVFTSGSTGKPKGVVIEHTHYATSGRSLQKRLSVSPQSRVFQFASHAFDVSVSDYLTTLMTGGCICVPSEAERLNDIPHAVARLKANWMHITPSVARTIQPSQVPGINTLVLSGEALQEDNVRTWAAAVHLINAYGPAECSVDCVVNDQVASCPESIGTASAAVSWIADVENPDRLLPIGAVGELLVEGPIVGRGYLQEEELTRQAFVSPPAWLRRLRGHDAAASRLYRTGDLVQYLPSGALRYIGRHDGQSKINGQRVELGEIESHLSRLFPASQGVTVALVPQPQPSSQRTLTAFVQWGEGVCEDTGYHVLKSDPDFCSRIRDATSRLREWLPPYMVPVQFLAVSRIPLSRSGKADRTKLGDLALATAWRQPGGEVQKPPRSLTVTEQQIKRLCADVLGFLPSKVDIDADFFYIGGDSIKAMQLVSHARREGMSITVGQILRSTTLADLARTSPQPDSLSKDKMFGNGHTEPMDAHLLHSLPWDILSFQEHNVVDILPAIDLQAFSASRPQNYWFLELKGPIDTTQLKQAGLELIQRHAILRTVFVLQNEKTLQVVLRRLTSAIVELETDETDLMKFAVAHSRKDSGSQRLYGEPPLQLTLVRSHDEHHVLIMRLSHAQYDGMSMPILMKDLMELYQKRDIGTATSFTEYTRHCLLSYTEEAFTYWRELLRGAFMTLMSRQPRALGLATPQATLVEVTASVRRFTPPPGITDATVVKTAWALTQSRVLQRQTDLVFGQLVSGRSSEPGLAAVVGPCINLLPVRVQLPGPGDDDEPVAALLRRVQDQHAASVDFEALPLSVVAARCTPWDPAVEFGSIVHHRHAPDQVRMRYGVLETYVDAWSPVSLPGRNLWLSSIVDDAGRLQLDLYCSSEVASKERLEHVLGVLCDVFRALDKGFMMPVTQLL